MSQDQSALLDELLSHPDFRAWATGDLPELDAFWESWIANDPLRKDVLESAKTIILSFHSGVRQVSNEYIQKKIGLALSASPAAEQEDLPGRRLLRRHTLMKAALILLIPGLCWSLLLLSRRSHETENPVERSAATVQRITGENSRSIKNTLNRPQHILLADGSSAILQPGSELRFPEVFPHDRREVHLSGEAFFEVMKDPLVPFYVVASQTVTKVVGTSFRIKARPQTPLLEINVKSGTVAVFRDKVNRNYNLNEYPQARLNLLTQNEKAIFDISGNELSTYQVVPDAPARLPIEQLSFLYEATPVTKVFSDLKTAYGVDIIYEASQFNGCSLTAELGDEPLTKKIKWICAILEAHYTISDNTITITGTPCQ